VGTLGIVDFDVVDESNLQRQVIHGQSDIGRSKPSPRATASVRSPVRERDRAQGAPRLRQRDGDLRGYDLIVDGTDNFATRYLVNDACVLLGKPYVWGSSTASTARPACSGRVRTVLRCLYPSRRRLGWSVLRRGGVLGVLCASIGSIQVNEAIKLIAGIGEPLAGRLMIYDALEMTYRSVKVRKDRSARSAARTRRSPS